MKKPLSRIIAVIISAAFAGFATSALAEVTTTTPIYSPASPHYGHYARKNDLLASNGHKVSESTITIHVTPVGPSKVDPVELNHKGMCGTPICRGLR